MNLMLYRRFGDFGEVRQAKLTYRLYRIRGASAILQIPVQRDSLVIIALKFSDCSA